MRTGLHKAVRELFKGKLDSETDVAAPATDDEGSRIAIKWGGGRGGAGKTGGI